MLWYVNNYSQIWFSYETESGEQQSEEKEGAEQEVSEKVAPEQEGEPIETKPDQNDREEHKEETTEGEPAKKHKINHFLRVIVIFPLITLTPLTAVMQFASDNVCHCDVKNLFSPFRWSHSRSNYSF